MLYLPPCEEPDPIACDHPKGADERWSVAEVNLLRSIPKAQRNIDDRALHKDEQNIRRALEFGYDYFDGSRDTGYGGYVYDGRWQGVARDIADPFQLKPGDRVLAVGCAKGFLVNDLVEIGLEAFGVDVSEYALANAHPGTEHRLFLGTAANLPFPDSSFACVTSINTVHNLREDLCVTALAEIERLAPGKGFVQVDCYRTPEEEANFRKWVLTAQTHGNPDYWVDIFRRSGYTGDWFWTIAE